MCTVLLPQGVNPIAVDKYIINLHIDREEGIKSKVPSKTNKEHIKFGEHLILFTM